MAAHSDHNPNLTQEENTVASISLTCPIACPPHRVRQLLLDEAFLAAFVDEQEPVHRSIAVDRGVSQSDLKWTISLDGDLPELVTTFVGRRADLQLVFDLRVDQVRMTARAKRTGTLQCAFRIVPVGAAASMFHLDGEVKVGGMLGGLAEGTLRDQVIEPVFREDLVRLLQQWCADDAPGAT